MGNICNLSKNKNALPIETPFSFQSPLPIWPQGGGFANGTIDLGGIEVCQLSTFTKVWVTNEGGADNHGASFFNPTSTPNNFYMLGSYAQPNNKSLFGYLLVARDTSCGSKLAKPLDFTLTWSSESLNIKKEGDGFFWLPVAPNGYKALGHVVTNSPTKPSVDSVRCVINDFTDQCETDLQIWSNNELNVYSLRPVERTVTSLGIMVGTFVAKMTNSSFTISCLKNKNTNYTYSMPNISQIQVLVKTYSPLVYFHPDEEYLPSSVPWFFKKGALLYHKDNADNPVQVNPNGSNLPQGGSNDGQFWLDLPKNNNDSVKKGDLPSCKSYFHVKPMFGGTFTDIAIWIFYPFNGPAKAKVAFISLKLGRIGQHVGDWEHVTLRVNNFNGELSKVYFAEHGSGSWAEASELEYAKDGNKFNAYASLNGHAFYKKAGLYMQGKEELGIRNDCDRGKSMDTGMNCEVVSVGYGDHGVVEPAWLGYMREWGPKVTYDIAEEIKGVGRFLPRKVRDALEKFVRSLPDEVLGEEGPTGPKEKSSWTMDEES